MAKLVDNFGVVTTTFAADVTNTNTFTVPYPTGTTQANFTTGQAAPAGAFMIVNNNDRWTVAAAKISVSYGASLITVTNSTGQTLLAGSTIRLEFDQVDGDVVLLQFPVQLAAIGGNVDVITAASLGIVGVIEYAEFIVTTPVTTAGKLATLNLYINAVAVTGGAIALTSAAATPLGKVIAVAGITALNAIGAADTFSVKATGVTAFAEGQGVLNIRVRKALQNFY